MVEATQASFDEEIRASVPVLVDFWAPWCGPCRMVTPAVEHLAEVYAGQLKLVKLNVDEAPEIAARFGVQGIPLLVVIRDGEEIARQVGAAASGPLRAWLESHIGPPKPDTAGEAAGTAPGAAAGPG
jgi:thioredoxin 2